MIVLNAENTRIKIVGYGKLSQHSKLITESHQILIRFK